MDKTEARLVLEEFLRELQQKSYEELQSFISNPVCLERRGPSGVVYQIEYEALWDKEPHQVLRIIAAIDDGGFLSALMPVTAGFLVTPSGEIVE
jgi:hypothetical protein